MHLCFPPHMQLQEGYTSYVSITELFLAQPSHKQI